VTKVPGPTTAQCTKFPYNMRFSVLVYCCCLGDVVRLILGVGLAKCDQTGRSLSLTLVLGLFLLFAEHPVFPYPCSSCVRLWIKRMKYKEPRLNTGS
jgi:hypothetical protein